MRTFEQEKDLFFIDRSTYDLLTDELKTTVVCPKDEFKGHAIYKNFHVSNCHRTWWLAEYDYVIVAHPGWYESLPMDKRRLVFDEQKRTGSRMMMGDVLMTQQYWASLTREDQQKVLHLFDEKIEPVDLSNIPDRFRRLHSVFPDEHGGNCFAAALYGVIDESYILNEWIHDQTFIDMLSRNHYYHNDDVVRNGVLVFQRDGFVVHACYIIDDNYCFNKSGQTFFNPWHIAAIDKVLADWEDCDVTCYCHPVDQGNKLDVSYAAIT